MQGATASDSLCCYQVSRQDNPCIFNIQLHSASSHSILRPTLPLLRMCIDELWRESSVQKVAGVAWSLPIATRRNVLVFCWAPLTCHVGIHLRRLPWGSLWVLPSQIAKATLVSWRFRFIWFLSLIYLYSLLSLSFQVLLMNSGVSLWDCNPQP